MMIKIKKQSGLTLIEMMIAMLIGLLVTGAIISVFISNVKSSSENIKMMQLNQELRTVMGFMSDEIKRSGYSSDATVATFINDFNTATANCVLYSYDVNGNGVQTTNEKFGFRLNGNTIQWGSNVACGSNTNWQNLTAPNIANIIVFSIVPSDIPAGTITIKQLVITITGVITLNPGSASRTITETIRVRNEDAS
jgi:prepilin-type N-terminal cleavage/methylation domain-containing protein